MAGKNPEFTERLKKAIHEAGLDNPTFAKKSGIGYSTLMNYLNPNNIGKVPEWDQLIRIANTSGKTIDWLLSGEQFSPDERKGAAAVPSDVFKILNEVYASDDEETKLALTLNIKAFKKSIERESENKEMRDEIQTLRKEVRTLREIVSPDQSAGTGRGEGTGTGKKRKQM
jgi:transcriptional regulator with XRE-family HTH domain